MNKYIEEMAPLANIPATPFAASEAAVPDEESLKLDARSANPRLANAQFAQRIAIALLQLNERDPALVRGLIAKISAAYSVKSAYVPELVLRMISDQPLPGPLELATRYGISKQAVSHELLLAIDELAANAPVLARQLEVARLQYRTHPGESIAPRYKVVEYPLPRSGEGAFELELDGGKKVFAKLVRRGGEPVAVLRDGTEIAGPFAWCLEESREGTMKPDARPWLRRARS